MEETPLAETRNIDDQVEWLDDENVLYADGQDVWTVRSDGSGSARMFIAEALSPAVVREIIRALDQLVKPGAARMSLAPLLLVSGSG